jgi:hypothetical protein
LLRSLKEARLVDQDDAQDIPAGIMARMETAPYQSLDDVVDGFGALESQFRQRRDRRAIFLTLYGVVSAEMRARVAQRTFRDNDWVHRYAVAFANLYRQALDNYESGRMADVPKAWRLCFDAAARGTGLVLQDMFLGVNAHVNNDLPLALSLVKIDPDRPQRYADHAAVNGVLGSVTERATQRIAALYAPGIAALDDCAGQLDELTTLFSLDVARESAWDAAVSLANARNSFERDLSGKLIAGRAAVMARLLLSPSTDPALIAACRHLEQGCDVLTLVADACDAVHQDRTP